MFCLRCHHSKVFLCIRNPSVGHFVKRKLLQRGQLFASSSWDSGRGCRHFSSGRTEEQSRSLRCNPLDVKDNFVLYRFNWIKHLRFISRAKILHVAVVISLTWPMSHWYYNGLISLSSLTCAIIGALGTTAGLAALSYFVRRIVGELSINEATQKITISSLTFWGNRCNRTFPITSLVPLSDSGVNMKNTFHRLELYGYKGVYLLNLRHCKIFDEMFFSVIGLHKYHSD